MALTRDFKETVVARVSRDPDFAKALLDEASTLFSMVSQNQLVLSFAILLMPPLDLRL